MNTMNTINTINTTNTAKRNFPFTIKQVAEILKLRIRYTNPTSGNLDTDCPFCDGKSKLNLNIAENIYRCSYCGESGGMVVLYGKMHGIPNSEAYREICEILECGKVAACAGADTSNNNSPTPQSSRADAETLHQTYAMMLTLLSLASPHKEYLSSKGFSPEQIDESGYKSVPAFGQRQLCEKLLQSGCTLEGVPGFHKDSGTWNVKLKAPGIIIPIRGIDGKIAGMQMRLDKPINERKFIWLSSKGLDGGASPGSPIHFAGDPTAKRVYVTDGALKGSVAHALSGRTFACLPGVKNLGELDELLARLKANGTVGVFEAFDIDKLTDNHIAESATALREKLALHGFRVKSTVWEDKSLRNVSDYIMHRMREAKNHVYGVDISGAGVTAATAM